MIIGLCGYAGVGKDMLAAHLVSKHNFRRFAFADELKKRLSDLCLDFGADINNPEDKKKLRPLLVAYGEAARTFNSDYWIDKLWYHACVWPNVVITDVRYLNEARSIEFNLDKSYGKLIRVRRWNTSEPGVSERSRNISGLVGPANETEDRTIAEVVKTVPSLLFDNYGPVNESIERWEKFLKDYNLV